MKLSIAALSITLATAASAINSNSDVGRNLLSKARRLDGGNDDNDYQEDTTWMQKNWMSYCSNVQF